MDKRDKLWLRVLTIAFALFVLLLAYFGWSLGQDFEADRHNVRTSIKEVHRNLDLKQQEIDILKVQLEEIRKSQPAKDGKNGENGRDGNNGAAGKDGVTKIERHDTQTTIQTTIPAEPLQPLNGINGKTPEFAIDGDTKRLMMRYEGDDEYVLVPILCKALTVMCKMEP